MRTNLAERLGYEPEEETRERQERLLEELRYREAMRRVVKTCCVWLGGAAFVLAVIAGYAEMADACVATGVRWAESQKRKSRGVMEALHKNKEKRLTLMNDNDESRMLMENCQLKGTWTVNPIIDWQDADIWDYCTAEKISMNPLYACGFERVGCIGCPMAGKHRKVQFVRYPKIKAAYVRAFDRMLAERQTRGLPCDWQTGEDVMHWWMEDGVLPGQMVFEGMEDET